MNTPRKPAALVHDELDLLSDMVALADQHIVELGCGAAQLARALLARHPGSRVTERHDWFAEMARMCG